MNRSLIYRATASDESGHISEVQINQIVELTNDASDPTIVSQVISFIGHRLTKPDVFIKLRCCKLIRHLCERGRPEVRRVAQRELVDALRLLAQYNGPPHPTRGTEINRSIRQAAQEALTAVFASDNSSAEIVPPLTRPNSFRSPPKSSHRTPVMEFEPGPCVQSGRMVGFGNVEYPKEDTSALSTSLSSFRTIIDTITAKLPPLQGGRWGSGQRTSKGTDNFCTYAENPNAAGWSKTSDRANHYSSQSGYSSEPATTTWQPQDLSGDSFNFRQSRRQPDAALSPARTTGLTTGGSRFGDTPPRMVSASEITSTEPGDFEVALVDRLTEAGGLRLNPAPQALEEFKLKCENLDFAVVLLALFGKIDDDAVPWQQRLRCLCVLEFLLKPNDRLSQTTRTFVQEHPGCLDNISSLERNHQCRLTAKHVLSLLHNGNTMLKPAPQRPDKPEGGTSLLDLDGDDSVEVSVDSESSQSVVTTHTAALLDLDMGTAQPVSKSNPVSTNFPFVYNVKSRPPLDTKIETSLNLI
eukprot:Blabericola_migrator_1__13522@NODE_988_length_5794_cov_180_252314_g681_i0_p2_GENE_NODE_988_length_5794_cov_180_252314_g681_i0NODE_988_length_5794_cov_180_252314_g681_i0_p2_ORF_typecomplete_len526_score72_70ENTH/PF01417_20/3_6e07ENTH/PF01417_20/0_65_NODE_988_length_5794_cov_180_252314_g681_i0491626